MHRAEENEREHSDAEEDGDDDAIRDYEPPAEQRVRLRNRLLYYTVGHDDSSA
jgi:hypothetical protein